MKKNVNNFIHIVILVTDLQKAYDFYTAVFSWKITPINKETKEIYFEVLENGDLMSGTIAKNDKINGNESLFVYIYVDDLEEKSREIEKFGGKIKHQIHKLDPYSGRMLVFYDPFGNKFGLWSDN